MVGGAARREANEPEQDQGSSSGERRSGAGSCLGPFDIFMNWFQTYHYIVANKKKWHALSGSGKACVVIPERGQGSLAQS